METSTQVPRAFPTKARSHRPISAFLETLEEPTKRRKKKANKEINVRDGYRRIRIKTNQQRQLNEKKGKKRKPKRGNHFCDNNDKGEGEIRKSFKPTNNEEIAIKTTKKGR